MFVANLLLASYTGETTSQQPEIHRICQRRFTCSPLAVCGLLGAWQPARGRECLMRRVGGGDEQLCTSTSLDCWREEMEKAAPAERLKQENAAEAKASAS